MHQPAHPVSGSRSDILICATRGKADDVFYVVRLSEYHGSVDVIGSVNVQLAEYIGTLLLTSHLGLSEWHH